MSPRRFVSELGGMRFPNSFNPYSECCEVCDLPDAPSRRAAMLTATIEAAVSTEVDAIWVGRDLGYRGGRRTGLAFTDDLNLATHQAMWGIKAIRATRGAPVSERSATVVWNILRELQRPILLWNVFPLHPHEPGKPFTNRLHTRDERRAGTEVLRELIGMVQPMRLIAIGNDAEKAIESLSPEIKIIKVRHPSFGGQTEFLNQIRDLYGSQEWKLL